MMSLIRTAYSTTLALLDILISFKRWSFALLSMYYVYFSIENLQVAIKMITHTGQGIQYPHIL